MPLPPPTQRSPRQRQRGAAARRWPRRESQIEGGEEALPFVAGFGAAHAEEFAAVGGRHGDGEPLHGRPFFEDGTGPEPAGGSGQWLAQREREAGGEKRDEPVGPDALAPLMNDGPQAVGARERAERCFAKTPLPIAAPDQLRIVGAQVGAQPIAAFTTAPGAPFVTVQPIRESAVRRDLGLPPTCRAACPRLVARRPAFSGAAPSWVSHAPRDRRGRRRAPRPCPKALRRQRSRPRSLPARAWLSAST